MYEKSKLNIGAEKIMEKLPPRESLKGWLSLTLLMGILFVFCSVFYVWLRIQQIQDGYELAKRQEEYAELMTVQRKLHLEWNRLQDPYFLEQLAKERFGLNPPRKDQRLLLH
jgi:cell division protein FtsL